MKQHDMPIKIMIYNKDDKQSYFFNDNCSVILDEENIVSMLISSVKKALRINNISTPYEQLHKVVFIVNGLRRKLYPSGSNSKDISLSFYNIARDIILNTLFVKDANQGSEVPFIHVYANGKLIFSKRLTSLKRSEYALSYATTILRLYCQELFPHGLQDDITIEFVLAKLQVLYKPKSLTDMFYGFCYGLVYCYEQLNKDEVKDIDVVTYKLIECINMDGISHNDDCNNLISELKIYERKGLIESSEVTSTIRHIQELYEETVQFSISDCVTC